MKTIHGLLVLILGTAFPVPCHSSGSDTSQIGELKYFEFKLGYNQVREGYVDAVFNIYRVLPQYFTSFTEHGISAGYSPWKNAIKFETNHRLTLLFISAGFGGGYCRQVPGDANTWFLKPELGFNFNYFQVYYGYSFLTVNPGEDFFNKGSNFVLTIPFASTDGFWKLREKKKYHWGAVFSQRR